MQRILFGVHFYTFILRQTNATIRKEIEEKKIINY